MPWDHRPLPGAAEAAALPPAVRDYLLHVAAGMSLRRIAAARGCHPSTVLRRVRGVEARRDDPLYDGAIEHHARRMRAGLNGEEASMGAEQAVGTDGQDEAALLAEARRVLARLAERGVFLAVAPGMERAGVFRPVAGGMVHRVATVPAGRVREFVLRDWIRLVGRGKVARYEISSAGRALLRRMLAAEELRAEGFEPDLAFADQHRDPAMRSLPGTRAETRSGRVRMSRAESPVAILARRRDRNGKPFLSPEQVAAAERLREDFELAQMGPRVAQNWDRFLTAGAGSALRPDSGLGEGPRRARERLRAALEALGPGLSDVAIRCCCFLEGLEATERRMGWSARSGKVVLRIALTQLARHYAAQGPRPPIG